MYLSIIIPAYNESTKIGNDVRMLTEFIEQNNLQAEIIVVDDGSADNTAYVAKSVEIPSDISLQVIRYEPNRGKGFAVRTGIESSKGDYVVFTDSGQCVPYDYILNGIKIIAAGEADIAHGSRKLKSSKVVKPHPWTRQLISKLFRLIFIVWLRIPAKLTDTQCGFKIYKGDVARKLYAECLIDGFLFDIEIIVRALKHGYRINEFPIEWTADLDSRLAPAKNTLNVLKGLITLKHMLSHF